jgi:hypothetical protein
MSRTGKTPSAGAGLLRAAAVQAKPKTRKCALKGCGNRFQPRSIGHRACGPDCAIALAAAERGRLEAKQTRERKVALKTKPEWLKEAQAAFNGFVRMRDRLAGYVCISSGRPLDWSGNAVDAGHYRSVGSAPHLRFNEDNCHAQSKHDNQYKSGNAIDYRLGLIARIGLARVEALEADQAPRHYTIDDLKRIKAEYKAKLRTLKEST